MVVVFTVFCVVVTTRQAEKEFTVYQSFFVSVIHDGEGIKNSSARGAGVCGGSCPHHCGPGSREPAKNGAR